VVVGIVYIDGITISREGTAYPSGAPAFTPGVYRGSYCSLVYCVMFCRSVFVLLSFYGHCFFCPSVIDSF
jgi:hypothetical protein